jgi:hypothetical protein
MDKVGGGGMYVHVAVADRASVAGSGMSGFFSKALVWTENFIVWR